MQRVTITISAVFIAALAVQGWLWFSYPSTDAELWIGGSRFIAEGMLPGAHTLTPTHPGTTIIVPTGLLIASGLPALASLHLVMTILVSISITLIVYQCMRLRQRNLWWLGTALLLIPNPFYLMMTPPSVVAGLLAALFVLVLLEAYEHNASGDEVFWLGLIAGVMLATRIDIGAALIVVSVPLMWSWARTKVATLLATAALFYLACDIYMWNDPVRHLMGFVGQIGANVVTPIGFGYTAWILLLSGISVALALVFAFLKPQFSSVRRNFLLWMLAISTVICGAILVSDYHPARYFFPIMMIWEVFVSLFILEIIEKTNVHSNRWLNLTYVAIALLFLSRVIPGVTYIL